MDAHQWLKAILAVQEERRIQLAMIRMTRHMQLRLGKFRRRVENAGGQFDEAAWKQFLSRLVPEERRFLRAFFPNIRDALARVIAGTPLAKLIRHRRGRWPIPAYWSLNWSTSSEMQKVAAKNPKRRNGRRV